MKVNQGPGLGARGQGPGAREQEFCVLALLFQ